MELGQDIEKDGEEAPFLNLSVEVLSDKEAKLCPAGQGRSDPNQDPYLPQPTGRF